MTSICSKASCTASKCWVEHGTYADQNCNMEKIKYKVVFVYIKAYGVVVVVVEGGSRYITPLILSLSVTQR